MPYVDWRWLLDGISWIGLACLAGFVLLAVAAAVVAEFVQSRRPGGREVGPP